MTSDARPGDSARQWLRRNGMTNNASAQTAEADDLATKEFSFEDVMRPGGQALAWLANRMHGNQSGLKAIADVKRAAQHLSDNPAAVPDDVAAALGIKQASTE